MEKFSDAYLRKKRNALVKTLQRLSPHIVRGSFIESYKPCGKPGCKCATGLGHGPKYYLVASHAGKKQKTTYVPLKYQTQIKKYLENFKNVKETLEIICNINLELLKRRTYL